MTKQSLDKNLLFKLIKQIKEEKDSIKCVKPTKVNFPNDLLERVLIKNSILSINDVVLDENERNLLDPINVEAQKRLDSYFMWNKNLERMKVLVERNTLKIDS
jgi:hypothetical protein